MLCSKCKNPIEDNAAECEWCGAKILQNISNSSFITDNNSEKVGYSFIMPIEDVFSIIGRGIVAVGRIQKGYISSGQQVQIIDNNIIVAQTICTGIEMFRKILDTAKEGDNVGLLLRGMEKDAIKKGMLIIKSENSIYQNINNSLDAELIGMLKAGNKLSAIKVYHDRTGLGIKESKEYVDKLSIENNLIPPNTPNTKSGCMSVIILLILFSSIIGIIQHII